jgi:hypothetical protein
MKGQGNSLPKYLIFKGMKEWQKYFSQNEEGSVVYIIDIEVLMVENVGIELS